MVSRMEWIETVKKKEKYEPGIANSPQGMRNGEGKIVNVMEQ
jgi:hypothetical protein